MFSMSHTYSFLGTPLVNCFRITATTATTSTTVLYRFFHLLFRSFCWLLLYFRPVAFIHISSVVHHHSNSNLAAPPLLCCTGRYSSRDGETWDNGTFVSGPGGYVDVVGLDKDTAAVVYENATCSVSVGRVRLASP